MADLMIKLKDLVTPCVGMELGILRNDNATNH